MYIVTIDMVPPYLNILKIQIVSRSSLNQLLSLRRIIPYNIHARNFWSRRYLQPSPFSLVRGMFQQMEEDMRFVINGHVYLTFVCY